MKTSVLIILLFGFGYLAPFSCGKQQSKTKKSSETIKAKAPRLALFYPVVLIKDSKRNA